MAIGWRGLAIACAVAVAAGGPRGQDAAPPGIDRSRGILHPEVAAVVQGRSSPDELLAWVRRSIRFESYAGALRGPLGTLRASAGNSLDQALLLRDLVRIADLSTHVRFAVAELPAQAAEQLVAAWLETRRRAASAAAASDATTGSAAPPEAAQGLEKSSLLSGIVDEARERAHRVADDADALAALLLSASPSLASAVVPTAELVEAARRHVWLQVEVAGQWRDLDPILPEGTPQLPRPAAAKTLAELPEEWFHHVSLDVVVEIAKGDARVEETVLESDWRSADLVGSTIALMHAEPWGVPIANGGETGADEAFRQGFCTPLLAIDDEIVAGRRFRAQPERAPDGLAGAGHAAGGRVGDLLGGGRKRTKETTDLATAEWLEVIVHAPDGTRERHLRPLFDRIGPVARASPGDTEFDRSRAPSVEQAIRGVYALSLWVGERGRRAPLPAPCAANDVTGSCSLVEMLGSAAGTWFGLQQEYVEQARSGTLASAYCDSPHVFSLAWLPGVEGAETHGDGFVCDAIRSCTRWVPGTEEPLRARTLWARGALEAEETLVAIPDRIAAQTAAVPVAPRPSVARVFEASALRGDAPTVLEARSVGDVARLAASDEARWRIRERIGQGQLVVVPMRVDPSTRGESLGWWFVDPRDGFVCDEMENGRRQTGNENTQVTKETEKEAQASTTFARKLGRAACVLLVVLGVVEHGIDAHQAFQAGDVAGVESALADLADDELLKALKECKEGQGPPLPLPKGKSTPKFPRPKNVPLPKGPYLPKRPWRPGR